MTIEARLMRIEALLVQLLAALVDEPEAVVTTSLDGSVQSTERDQSQPL